MFLFLLLVEVSSLHLYLTEGSERCFIVDIPESTIVLSEYRLIDPQPATIKEPLVKIRIVSPVDEPVLYNDIRELGKLSFTSQFTGVHKICLFLIRAWLPSKKARIQISIDINPQDTAHDELASVEQVGHLENIAGGISKRLQEIARQQEYSREKEADFKDESENVNSKVIYFTLFQTAMVLVSSAWQIISLRSFFIKKKII